MLGAGYATEALRALLAHLLAAPGVRRVVAETLVGHVASRRVLEKAGMRRCGHRTSPIEVTSRSMVDSLRRKDFAYGVVVPLFGEALQRVGEEDGQTVELVVYEALAGSP